MDGQTTGKSMIFTFLGPPGSGKGTLAQRCEQELGFLALSTGNLSRKHIALGTDFGKLLEQYVSAGRLVPDNLITEIVGDWLRNHISAGKPIILDGYPRTKTQAEMFHQLLKAEKFDVSYRVILFEISENTVVVRLSNRLICSNNDCQAVYSLKSRKPARDGICDFCGAPLRKRDDDREEVIRERLKTYARHLDEMLGYYASIDQPVEQINVDTLTPTEVFQKFNDIL